MQNQILVQTHYFLYFLVHLGKSSVVAGVEMVVHYSVRFRGAHDYGCCLVLIL